jgi:hypothetical protein
MYVKEEASIFSKVLSDYISDVPIPNRGKESTLGPSKAQKRHCQRRH